MQDHVKELANLAAQTAESAKKVASASAAIAEDAEVPRELAVMACSLARHNAGLFRVASQIAAYLAADPPGSRAVSTTVT